MLTEPKRITSGLAVITSDFLMESDGKAMHLMGSPLLVCNIHINSKHTVSGNVSLNGFKLEESRLRFDIKKKFFTMRVVMHWNRLPRRVVDSPSLEVLKVRLDGAWRNLVQWKVFLPLAGELELDDLYQSLATEAIL
ncbi:hypothetical protein BTVI_122975 [Pitangus sulphuratus]|nr:hypothetical protein BTVI_122975 [Pitangus sulphuratus]